MSEIIITCEERDFSSLAAAVGEEVSSDCPLSAEIVIVDKEEIHRLNREFRQVDRPTDVLSFPTLDGIRGKLLRAEDFPYDVSDDGSLFIGSIVICEQVAREQAAEYGHSFERELYYLAAHGMCHLLGYDHIEDGDRTEMRQKEERIMTKLNLKRD